MTISSPTFHVTAFIRFNVFEPLFAVWAKWVQGIGTGIPDFIKKVILNLSNYYKTGPLWGLLFDYYPGSLETDEVTIITLSTKT